MTRDVVSHADAAGRLEVACWCQATTVRVSPDRVRAGDTGSCGAPGCIPDPPDELTMARAAKSRAAVRLADGRTGWLIYWPIPRDRLRPGRKSTGARAKVGLPSGAVLSVPPDTIQLDDEPQ